MLAKLINDNNFIDKRFFLSKLQIISNLGNKNQSKAVIAFQKQPPEVFNK